VIKNTMFNINIRLEYGWRLYNHGKINLWFSGYLAGSTVPEKTILDSIDFLDDKVCSIGFLSKWVNTLDGHFAFILEVDNSWCFIATDKICSIPVFNAYCDGKYTVSNHAPYLKSLLNIGNDDVSLDAALEISMSGFVLGNKTLYKDIGRFSAGECVLLSHNKTHRSYYYTYTPWEDLSLDYSRLKNDLNNAILSAIKKTIDSVGGRQIVVPLSAGNDSRLIASCLKKLEYENVICFSYGRRGNYEVNTSKQVCDILGYKWVYVQDILSKKRAFFMSDEYKEYLRVFESYASVPNIQDIYEVHVLKQMSIIDNDAVIVNGNSGDFISGGHVPENFNSTKKTLPIKLFNWRPFLKKHYSLWSCLHTRLNDDLITIQLSKVAYERCKVQKNNIFMEYSIMECMECIGRQSRLVANQQRSYEFVGHEWRLPLWGNDMLHFWERVPVQYKVKQRLYKDVLHDSNWGGVWTNIDVNKKLIRPYNIYFARIIVKIIAAPFGKNFWHKVEKNLFIYWMHPSYARSVAPFFSVLFDIRGQRNTNSWTADQFIKKNGFNNGVTDISDKIHSQSLKTNKKS
jgi:asparagine synthase (glutamine-hydrolysing)